MSNPTDIKKVPRLGWRKRGGGATFVERLPEVNGSSKQLAGLYPFHAQGASNSAGVPLGRHAQSGHPILWDMVTAFKNKELTHPSLCIIGGPAQGKSELGKQFMSGLMGLGVIPLCFGDTKGEHGELITALGGRVFRVGPSGDSLNILDPGGMWAVSKTLPEAKRATYLAGARSNRLNLLAGLIEMNRSAALADHETTILSRALVGLDEAFKHRSAPPVINDLIELLAEKPQYIRDAAVSDGDDNALAAILNPLRRSIIALAEGSYGEIFAHQTSTPLDLSKPLCIDISGVRGEDLLRAVLWACWVEGFNSIESVQSTRKDGTPQQNYLVTIDELWRVLQSGSAMIKRLDSLVRLDRHLGVATLFITHGVTDFESVADRDIAAARSLISKIGATALFGLKRAEVKVVSEYVELNEVEQDILVSWAGGRRGTKTHGIGKTLLKVGTKDAGTPVDIVVPQSRLKLANTNGRWDMNQTSPPIDLTQPADTAIAEPLPAVNEEAAEITGRTPAPKATTTQPKPEASVSDPKKRPVIVKQTISDAEHAADLLSQSWPNGSTSKQTDPQQPTKKANGFERFQLSRLKEKFSLRDDREPYTDG